MNGDPEHDEPSESTEASAEPPQAEDDIPAVKMEADPAWMDSVQYSKADPEEFKRGSFRGKRDADPIQLAEFRAELEPDE